LLCKLKRLKREFVQVFFSDLKGQLLKFGI
jgi:hypothetical protein